MKIKKSQLKQLIKEELEATMDEGILDKLKNWGAPKAHGTLLYDGVKEVKPIDSNKWTHEITIGLACPKGDSAGCKPQTVTAGVVLPLGKTSGEDKNRVAKHLEQLGAEGFMAAYDGPGGFKNVSAQELATSILQDAHRKAADADHTDQARRMMRPEDDPDEPEDPDAWIDYDEFTRGPNPARMVKVDRTRPPPRRKIHPDSPIGRLQRRAIRVKPD